MKNTSTVPGKQDFQTSFRMPAEMKERIDQLVVALPALPAYATWRVTPAVVMRLALSWGLKVMEMQVKKSQEKSEVAK